jgi:hypothetical protein
MSSSLLRVDSLAFHRGQIPHITYSLFMRQRSAESPGILCRNPTFPRLKHRVILIIHHHRMQNERSPVSFSFIFSIVYTCRPARIPAFLACKNILNCCGVLLYFMSDPVTNILSILWIRSKGNWPIFFNMPAM